MCTKVSSAFVYLRIWSKKISLYTERKNSVPCVALDCLLCDIEKKIRSREEVVIRIIIYLRKWGNFCSTTNLCWRFDSCVYATWIYIMHLHLSSRCLFENSTARCLKKNLLRRTPMSCILCIKCLSINVEPNTLCNNSY